MKLPEGSTVCLDHRPDLARAYLSVTINTASIEHRLMLRRLLLQRATELGSEWLDAEGHCSRSLTCAFVEPEQAGAMLEEWSRVLSSPSVGQFYTAKSAALLDAQALGRTPDFQLHAALDATARLSPFEKSSPHKYLERRSGDRYLATVTPVDFLSDLSTISPSTTLYLATPDQANLLKLVEHLKGKTDSSLTALSADPATTEDLDFALPASRKSVRNPEEPELSSSTLAMLGWTTLGAVPRPLVEQGLEIIMNRYNARFSEELGVLARWAQLPKGQSEPRVVLVGSSKELPQALQLLRAEFAALSSSVHGPTAAEVLKAQRAGGLQFSGDLRCEPVGAESTPGSISSALQALGPPLSVFVASTP
jgi:hypothetical protein